jgi:hypothetical protein
MTTRIERDTGALIAEIREYLHSRELLRLEHAAAHPETAADAPRTLERGVDLLTRAEHILQRASSLYSSFDAYDL